MIGLLTRGVSMWPGCKCAQIQGKPVIMPGPHGNIFPSARILSSPGESHSENGENVPNGLPRKKGSLLASLSLATPPHTPSLPSAMQMIAVPGIPESLLDFEPLHRAHSLDGTFTPPSASESFLQCLTLPRTSPFLTHPLQ